MIRPLAASLPFALMVPAASAEFQPFTPVEIPAAFSVNGEGQNVDTIAFWETKDSENTLMFVTAKDNSLVEVWAYPFVGNERTPITHSSFGNSNVNGIVVDQESDRAFVIVGASASTVSVFDLPTLAFEQSFSKPGTSYQPEPNCALLELPDDTMRLYVSNQDSVFVHEPITGSLLTMFRPSKGLETIVADAYYQALYIPDENGRTGVYAYDPDGNPYLNGADNRFGDTEFESDAEGILVYACPFHGPTDQGCGLIVVSDQRNPRTDFEVFDRASWDHLGKFHITGVNNTDGIASTQTAMPAYPMGLFVAVDSDAAVAGVGWDVILNATGLSCPTVVGVDESVSVAPSVADFFAMPNPFRRGTDLRFDILRSGHVSIDVFDVAGRLLRRLDAGPRAAGSHSILWNGRDANGARLAAGVYFARLTLNDEVRTHRIVLTR